MSPEVTTVKYYKEKMKAWPDDEPIFVLRARDIFGLRTVSHWIQQFCSYLALPSDSPNPKLKQAQATMQAMEKWSDEHGTKVPD